MVNSGFYDVGATRATFIFDIDGVEIGRFTEVSGLEVSIDVKTFGEGGENNFSHVRPGRMVWPNVTLKRGLTEQDSLLEWLNQYSGEGYEKRKTKSTQTTAVITLTSSAGERLRHWNFDGVFPVKWTGPSFAVDASEAGVESLEFSHQGFRVKTVPKPPPPPI